MRGALAGVVAALALTVGASPAAAVEPDVAPRRAAGYYLELPAIWHASVHVRVPTVTGCGMHRSGEMLGFGNEQTAGQPTLLATVALRCAGGAPSYETHSLAGGVHHIGQASPGDLLVLAMTQTRTTVTVVVRNKAIGRRTASRAAPTPDNALLFGSLPLFNHRLAPLPVADFGSAHLTRPHVEYAPLAEWLPTRVNRIRSGAREIVTSNFLPPSTCRRAGCGGSFRITVLAPG